ncbi:hypothetical protein [Cellulomonas soli]
MPGPAPIDGENVDPLTAWLLTLPADVLGDLIDRRPDTRIGPPLLSLADLALRLQHPRASSGRWPRCRCPGGRC